MPFFPDLKQPSEPKDPFFLSDGFCHGIPFRSGMLCPPALCPFRNRSSLFPAKSGSVEKVPDALNPICRRPDIPRFSPDAICFIFPRFLSRFTVHKSLQALDFQAFPALTFNCKVL